MTYDRLKLVEKTSMKTRFIVERVRCAPDDMDVGGSVLQQDAYFDAVRDLIATRFPRREPRQQMEIYLRGLLMGPRRKNGWTLAKYGGAESPDGMQRLLRTAEWDIEGVRDDIRGYVVAQFQAPDGVWLVDETGFKKRGSRSAGVARQYMRSTGKIENCQVGIYLAYASSRGEALVDRELYLPKSWADDFDRRAHAGIPAEVVYATKPELGLAMLDRAHSAGLLHGWVTADKTYGSHHLFRSWLADRGLPFVLATSNDDLLASATGQRQEARELAARALTGDLPVIDGWQRSSITSGPYRGQLFDWAAIELAADRLPDQWRHWLLILQQIQPDAGTHHRKLACYRCAGSSATRTADLIRVAGARWTSEVCFRTAKEECGLDQYQVRDWRAWFAHSTLAMVAAGYLAVIRSERGPGRDDGPVSRE
jgi:SRSO17 transposase